MCGVCLRPRKCRKHQPRQCTLIHCRNHHDSPHIIHRPLYSYPPFPIPTPTASIMTPGAHDWMDWRAGFAVAEALRGQGVDAQCYLVPGSGHHL